MFAIADACDRCNVFVMKSVSDAQAETELRPDSNDASRSLQARDLERAGGMRKLLFWRPVCLVGLFVAFNIQLTAAQGMEGNSEILQPGFLRNLFIAVDGN